MPGTRSADRATEFPQHSSPSQIQPSRTSPLQKTSRSVRSLRFPRSPRSPSIPAPRRRATGPHRALRQRTIPPRHRPHPRADPSPRLVPDDPPPSAPTAQHHHRPSNAGLPTRRAQRLPTTVTPKPDPLAQIKIFQLNVCGLRVRASEVAYRCHTDNFDIACLQETHLKPNVPPPSLMGYVAVSRQDRSDGYGGVITYVHKRLHTAIMRTTTRSMGKVQMCQIKMRTPRGPVKIQNVYAAPGWESTDPDWLNTLDAEHILVGDLNAKGSWDLNAAEKTCKAGALLEDSLHSCKLVVLNDGRPTRTSSNANILPSAIDVTATSARWTPLTEWTVDEHPTTDHHAVLTTIHTGRSACAPKKKRWAFRKADWDKYRDTLDRLLARNPPRNASVTVESKQLTTAIVRAAKAAVPKGRRAKEVPWWNEEVEKAIEARKRAWKAHQQLRTADSEAHLQHQTHEATKLINDRRREVWRATLSDLSARDPDNKLWRIVKGLSNRGRTYTPKSPPGAEHLSARKKAAWFLKQHIRKCKHLSKDTVHRNEYRQALDRARRQAASADKDSFTLSMLEKALKKMNGKKAGGPDDIQIRFLQELSITGKRRLLSVINRSYRQGVTPAAWRIAEMVAVEKPGKPGQFRPISLTNVIARCMERLVLMKLQPWAEAKLPKEQAGFRRYRSCEGQLAAFTESAAKAIQARRVGVAIFLDFSAAYDRVSVRRLLARLAALQCPPQLLCWMQSFLMDRRAHCRWETQSCKSRVIPNGLPQGSSLAPLLWNIYTADLPAQVQSATVALFADDTTVWKIGRTYKECMEYLQNAINSIEEYCTDNWILLNSAKTVLLPFGYAKFDQQDLEVVVSGTALKPSREVRYLGVTIDNRLTFSSHARQVAHKFTRRTRILAHLAGTSWGADERTIRTARNALLEPVAKYAASAWVMHASDSSLNVLERAHNVALRLQTGCCKPTIVEKLRELTGTRDLRTEASVAAAILVEKTARLAAQNLPCAPTAKPKCRRHRHTTQEAAEELLAVTGLLPLQRLPLPLPTTQPDLTTQSDLQHSRVKFYYTDCNRDEPTETRREKAELLLSTLPPADVEVWTDGSVGPLAGSHARPPLRVSIRWDDGWYCGTAKPLDTDQEETPARSRFRERHGNEPSHILYYDDGDTHAVTIQTVENKNMAVDEDGNKLRCETVPMQTVGGAGYVLRYRHDARESSGSSSAGFFCTSFTAEARAAIKAFERIVSGNCDGQRIRWVLNSLSLRQTLASGDPNQNALVHRQLQLMNEATARPNTALYVVWVSSHCGLHFNDAADRLAKEALSLPMEEHLAVPVEFHDARALLKRKDTKVTIDIDTVSERTLQEMSRRRAATLLNQLYTTACPLFHPLVRIFTGESGSCGHCDRPETVDHFFSCPGRARTKRTCFTERMGWKQKDHLQTLGSVGVF